MSGPTSYSALIRKTLETIKLQTSKMFNVLFILTDDDRHADDYSNLMHLIQYASSFPLSIIFVNMRERTTFETSLPESRMFDNLTQLSFAKLNSISFSNIRLSLSDRFGLTAFAKLPEQLNCARKLHFI